MNCHTSNQKGTSIMQHAGNCMVKAKAEMVIKYMFSLSARSQTRQNTVTDIPSQRIYGHVVSCGKSILSLAAAIEFYHPAATDMPKLSCLIMKHKGMRYTIISSCRCCCRRHPTGWGRRSCGPGRPKTTAPQTAMRLQPPSASSAEKCTMESQGRIKPTAAS